MPPQSVERWAFAVFAALCVGAVVGWVAAPDEAEPYRAMLMRADLPANCQRLLDNAVEELQREEQLRHEAEARP